jgi:uncharacterized membrane protein
LWNFFSKANRSPQIFFFWVGLFTLALAIGIFLLKPPAVPQPLWIYIGASGLVHFYYWWALGLAYQHGDISYVYPIARAAPGFIPLFAFVLLKENVSLQGLLGILCIVAPVYLLQQRDERMTPKDVFRYMGRPDALWAFTTLGTVIAYSLIDKKGMSVFHTHANSPDLWSAVVYYLFQSVIAFGAYCTSTMFRFTRQEITEIASTYWKTIGATALLAMASYTLVLIRHDDRKGELHRRPPAVFRNFRRAVWHFPLERILWPTETGGSPHHGPRHAFDDDRLKPMDGTNICLSDTGLSHHDDVDTPDQIG